MPPTEAAKRKAPEELGSSGASGWVVAFASRNIVCVMCFQQRGDCKIPLLRHFCQSGRNPLALRFLGGSLCTSSGHSSSINSRTGSEMASMRSNTQARGCCKKRKARYCEYRWQTTFPISISTLAMRHTRVLSTHAPSCPIAFFYPNRGRMPQRQPTPSCRHAFSRPLLSAQHLCCCGRKFAADNRQCVYICSLDFCILRELMARQSRWLVGSCRIQSRYAVT
jgi:hypothetical protein